MRPVAVLLAVVAVGPARGDDAEAFRDEYEPYWRRLTAHLWRNVKVAGVAEVRTPPPHLGLFRGTLRFEAVAGDNTLVWLGRYEPKGLPPPAMSPRLSEPFPPFAQLVVIRPEGVAAYQSSPPGVGWFRKRHAVPPWSRRYDHWLYHTHFTSGQLAWPLWAADIGRGPNAYFDPLRKTGLSALWNTRLEVARRRPPGDGREAAVVTGGGGWPSVWTYLRRPDYLVTERLTNSAWDGPVDGKPPSFAGVTVSYASAPPGELPFPSAARGWWLGDSGTREPADEVTFTEYRRHYPTADELNVEKRFGVRLPAFGPRPPLPPPGTYLDDPTDPKPPPPPAPKPPAERPPTEEELRRQTLIRSGILAGFAAAAGLAAVWWRRRN